MSSYPPVSGHCDRHLILFGRYPVPGKTKTRLIPFLGEVGAAEWHRRQAEATLAKIMKSRAIGSAAFCYTGADRRTVRRWLGRPSVRLIEQRGDHLGARMRTALFSAMDRGCRRVALVGTDIPQLSTAHIEKAFDALDHHDVVLGPSADGGYWLVAMQRKYDIFQNIPWGRATVLEQTMAQARNLGLRATSLPTLNDIDTPADLTSDPSWEGKAAPYLSVIVPALNEAGSIGAVIRRARSPECEIIVSDGGSHDDTRRIARDAGAVVVTGQAGRALQQNAGAAAARGSVLLFLHADTLLPVGYPRQVFETLIDHRVVAGAFRFKTDFDDPGMRLIEKAAHIRASLLGLPYGDQALFMPKAAFEKAGGFPLTPIAEDLYLVRRLRCMGDIRLARGAALTSGRRWRHIGVWRATAINYLIAFGCLLGVDPHMLAPLYRLWTGGRNAPKTVSMTGRR